MRHAAAILLLLAAVPAAAAPRPSREPSARTHAGPPHAWLFGAWTGGLFPVLDGMLEQDCRTQPTVLFAQDGVGHTTLVGGMQQRVIETVRTSPDGAEFRFTPAADDSGFGCEDANVLHVARASGTAISFPHCAAFPYPLERCPAG